jgi:hypothetical protein
VSLTPDLDSLRAELADARALIETLIAALDDASSVVDPSDDEEYAYQAELESARVWLETHHLTT